jgi:hypothetical protein
MNPIEFPLAAILGLGLLAIGFSRIFLALTNDQTVILGIVITALVVIVGFTVASRPHLSANLIVGLLVALALIIIALGIGGAVAGPHELDEDGAATIVEVVA